MKDRRAPALLRPFVTAGEVLVRPDGEGFDIVPLSLFRLADGRTCLRIGRNVLYFQGDGTYDGPEGRTKEMPIEESRTLAAAYGRCAGNRGRRPHEAHFAEGTPGHAAETGIWPAAEPDKARGRTH